MEEIASSAVEFSLSRFHSSEPLLLLLLLIGVALRDSIVEPRKFASTDISFRFAESRNARALALKGSGGVFRVFGFGDDDARRGGWGDSGGRLDVEFGELWGVWRVDLSLEKNFRMLWKRLLRPLLLD